MTNSALQSKFGERKNYLEIGFPSKACLKRTIDISEIQIQLVTAHGISLSFDTSLVMIGCL